MERREARNMEGLNRNQNKKQSSAVATAFEKLKKKKRNQPIKVVYISNPMKVKTTVAQFSSVVQGLTGRDSDLDASLSRYGDGAATGVPPPSLVRPVEDRCCCSADRDLSGDACAKQVADRELDQFDEAKFLEFLLAPPVYHELQDHVHFSH